MTSVRELCCKHNPASDEEHAVCDLCQSMTDYQPRTGFQVHLRPEEHERAIDLLEGRRHIEAAMERPCGQR